MGRARYLQSWLLATYGYFSGGNRLYSSARTDRDMSASWARRLRAMDRREAAFRVKAELSKLHERARRTVRPPRWDRSRLLPLTSEIEGAKEWEHARKALQHRDWHAAHRALAMHFAARRSAFPLDTRDLDVLAGIVRAKLPGASVEAAARAANLHAGRYDILGYEAVDAGRRIDWHRDPVHGRRAPGAQHWASVRYLDPAHGDHKVIWELNRHQHWLLLGRAFALTGDRSHYELFRDQLGTWLDQNPPLTGMNWASMLELAFRTLSWLWAIAFFSGAAREDGPGDPPWLPDALLAIDAQMWHVGRNLSFYFSPNTHLTGEGLALYVAGTCLPELLGASSWSRQGRDVLLQEAERQVRTDGGHAELSGHYHRYSTDFYLLALLVARRSGDPAAAAFEDAARRQARYLRTIADDQGRRPATGDDDGGQLFPVCGRDPQDCRDTLSIAAILLDEPALALGPVPEEAFWLCGERAAASAAAPSLAAWPSAALTETGYFVSRTGRGDHLLFDAGAHGFMNAGHAHSDALAVVLTVGGRPLLVDPGTATYTMDPELRDRFRDSTMHNTLVLDGRAPAVPAGPFAWRTRTDARAGVWRSGSAGDYVEGTHDAWLPVRHVRAILAVPGTGWWIVDHLVGSGEHDVDAFWHLHPSWRPAGTGRSIQLHHADGTRLAMASTLPLQQAADDRLAVWSPAYGRIERAPVLHVHARLVLPTSVATFIPAAPDVDRLTVERVKLATAPDRWHAHAWRAAWTGGSMMLLAAVPADAREYPGPLCPPARWGTESIRTRARVAAVLETAAHRDGTALLMVDDDSAGITRHRLPADLASSVHESARAELGTH